MSDSLLSNEELRQWLGGKQNRQVIKWLQERRVCYEYDLNRRPITTLAAIERAMMKEKATDEVDF